MSGTTRFFLQNRNCGGLHVFDVGKDVGAHLCSDPSDRGNRSRVSTGA